MTRISILRPSAISASKMLLLSASALAIGHAPAQAADVLYSSAGRTAVETGQRITKGSGVLQIRLDNGATLSFVDDAEFSIDDDGTVELYSGSVTVAGAGTGQTIVTMPEGVEGRVGGSGNAASFSVAADGSSNGHTLTGAATIVRGGNERAFSQGQMWASAGEGGIRRVMARNSQPAPGLGQRPRDEAQVAEMGEGGPVAAAENGLPVSLGDALAAAGARSDILAAARSLDAANANPRLDTYPVGDLALLVALAGNLEGAYGGGPFPQAQADVIRTYLGYLANGGSGAQFVTAYSGFLTQYLDLIRAGGLPSGFRAASQADIAAFLAYQGNNGALANLSLQNRVLAETYLAFLRDGGNPDQFAGQFTGLVEAYFAFVRGGGDPAQFNGASQQLIDAYIAFLGDSGLSSQLSASDQAILAAYLQNGSFAFASTYAEALEGYFAYLAAGGVPSASTTLTPAQLQTCLELLQGSGLFAQLLGSNAQFYADYLAFLQGGGDVDAFGQLNANVFAGYAGQLQAYFDYLQGGGLPSGFTTDPAVLSAYLAALDDAGALQAFLGGNADFFARYLAFVQGGGSADAFAGLNANIFGGYATALSAYYTYLAQGGLPSDYTALTQGQIAAYVAALNAQGASDAFLAGLADFYSGYFAYLQGGGDPDLYTGLPVLNLNAFAGALNAYAAFLAGGGLPSDFDQTSLATLSSYLDALSRSGQLSALLGANGDLLNAYFAYYGTGGNADGYSDLPIYLTYIDALNSYYQFLFAGGLPSDYTALTPEQIQSYLATLSQTGGLGTRLGIYSDFYTAYFAYLSTGGSLDSFSGLPLYTGYVNALNAYYSYLAGGGLPADYTALTQGQIADYLAALQAAGGFAAYGSLNTFFADYYAFISTGGNPAEFAGLPVYADYLAAIAAYYNFLAGGGVPSAYTAFSQAQIQAYLAALQASGLLDANFSGDVLAFYNNYLAYLAGGGVPDNFVGLPDGIDNQLAGLNSYVFGTGALFANTAAEADIADDGQITRIVHNSTSGNQTFDYSARTADLREFGRIGNDVAWTRYYVGAASGASNVSEHLLVGAKPVNLPASGTATYNLVGGTAPTDRRDVAGSTAWFTGSLGVAFGSTPLVGVSFDVLSGTEGYRVATLGGAADPSSGGMAVTAAGTFENQDLPITNLTGTTCLSFCQAQVFGSLFGEAGASAGFTYNIFDQTANNAVQGVSVFATSGTPIAGLGTMPTGSGGGTPAAFDYPYNGGFSTTGNAPGAFSYGHLQLVQSGDAAPVVAVNGNLQKFSVFEANGATGTEIFGDEYALIGRWVDGIPTVIGGTLAASENSSLHWSFGAASTSQYTLAGEIVYDLLGATSPTYADGHTAQGNFDGSLTINFASTTNHSATFAGVITMPDFIYNFSSTTGIGTLTGNRNLLQGKAQTGNPDCPANGCTFMADYVLAGATAGERVAISYLAYNGSNLDISGSALFGAPGTYTPGGSTGGSTGGTMATADGVVPTSATGKYVAYVGSGGDNTGPVASVTVTDGAYVSATGIGTGAEIAFTTNANTITETGGDQGVIGWQRSENVRADYRTASGQGLSANAFAGQSWHTIWATPLVNMPTTGLITYELIGSTKATQTNAQGGYGAFTGTFAVDFGTLKAGLDASVAFGGSTYAFASTGGVAAPSMTLLDDGMGSRRFSSSLTTIANGTTSVTRGTYVQGFLAGDGASHAGLTYSIKTSASNAIQGAATFRAEGSGAGGGTPAALTFTSGQAVAYAGPDVGIDSRSKAETAYNAGGVPVGYRSVFNGVVSDVERPELGNAQLLESGSAAGGSIGWARWADGTTAGRYYGNTTGFVLGPDSGFHLVSVEQLSNLPASGTVAYTLAGATAPTVKDGSIAPGTFSGTLSIAYGAAVTAAYDFAVSIGGGNYGFGATDRLVETTGEFAGSFFGNGMAVTGTGSICPTGACLANMRGMLGGNGGTVAGVSYNFAESGSEPLRTFGAAAFVQGQNTNNPYASAPTDRAIASVPGSSWSRWEPGSDSQAGSGSGNAGGPAPEMMVGDMAPGLEALAERGISFSPEQQTRLSEFYASRNP